MPVEVIAAVLNARTDLPLPVKSTLIALANHGSPDGTNVRPSQARIAEYLETPERTIRRYMKRLEDAGWITKISEAKPKRHLAAEYTINVDRLLASARLAANGSGQHRPTESAIPANGSVSTGHSSGRPAVTTHTSPTEPSQSLEPSARFTDFPSQREFMDTFCGFVGRNPAGGEGPAWGKVAKQMREAGVTLEEVVRRGVRYREEWPGVERSPMALWKNWGRFAEGVERPRKQAEWERARDRALQLQREEDDEAIAGGRALGSGQGRIPDGSTG